MKKIPQVSQSQLNKKKLFSSEEWGKVPLKLKQRYWAETAYSTVEPSPELMAIMRKAIDTGVYDDT